MSTEADFEAFVQSIFPTMSESDIEEVLLHYPSISNNTDPSTPLFYTNGISGPTAMSQNGVATGQNQRANVRPTSIYPICKLLSDMDSHIFLFIESICRGNVYLSSLLDG